MLLVRPALTVAHWCRLFDTKVIDGFVDTTAKVDGGCRAAAAARFDHGIIDGLVNVVGDACYARRRLAAQRADGLFAQLRVVPGAGRGRHLVVIL